MYSLANRDFPEQFDGSGSVGPVTGYGVSALLVLVSYFSLLPDQDNC